MTEFTAHGVYTVSNAGGFLIELSNCGDMARLKDNYGSDNPQVSEWFNIEYETNEDTNELEPYIDTDGLAIPLNEVIRI